jgi:hypothetical protein
MDPITVASEAFKLALRRAEALHPAMPLCLVASSTDRGDLVKTLRMVEWSAENRRPLVLHEAPFNDADGYFASLADKVRGDHDALREGAAKDGLVLPPLSLPQDLDRRPPAARAVALVEAMQHAVRPALDGVIIALCPKQIGDADAWRAVLTAWLQAPLSPAAHRWVHDLPDGPARALLPEPRHVRFEVDQAALMDYLARLDGAPASAGPPTAPPPALSPEQRAAVEAATGRPVPSPEVGRALRGMLMGGAVALQRNDLATAATKFGEARALCHTHAMPAEEASTLIALASLALAAGARDRAVQAYQEAIAVSRDAKLHPVTCQAWMGLGGTFLAAGRHGDAGAAYARAADAAKEGNVPLLRVEGLRLAGSCALMMGDERGALAAWQTAVDEGAAEPAETRAAGTLAQTGESLAALLTRHGLHAQAAHVRTISGAGGNG